MEKCFVVRSLGETNIWVITLKNEGCGFPWHQPWKSSPTLCFLTGEIITVVSFVWSFYIGPNGFDHRNGSRNFQYPWKSKTKQRMVFRMIHGFRIPYYQGAKFGLWTSWGIITIGGGYWSQPAKIFVKLVGFLRPPILKKTCFNSDTCPQFSGYTNWNKTIEIHFATLVLCFWWHDSIVHPCRKM